MPKWKRKVNLGMRSYGDIEEKKKVIQINPRKGELLNTIIHEELHKQFPKMTEEDIDKKAKQIEKRLTIKRAIQLLKKYA